MSIAEFATTKTLATVAANLTPHAAARIFAVVRWPKRGRPKCRCGSRDVAANQVGGFRCNVCRRRFSILSGTHAERSTVEPRVWLLAIWALTTGRGLVTARDLAAVTGIAPTTAGRAIARVRRVQSSMPRRRKRRDA